MADLWRPPLSRELCLIIFHFPGKASDLFYHRPHANRNFISGSSPGGGRLITKAWPPEVGGRAEHNRHTCPAPSLPNITGAQLYESPLYGLPISPYPEDIQSETPKSQISKVKPRASRSPLSPQVHPRSPPVPHPSSRKLQKSITGGNFSESFRLQ